MNGYRLHLVGNEKEELDSSKGTSVVTADSNASPAVVTNAVHAQASATSAPSIILQSLLRLFLQLLPFQLQHKISFASLGWIRFSWQYMEIL